MAGFWRHRLYVYNMLEIRFKCVTEQNKITCLVLVESKVQTSHNEGENQNMLNLKED